MENFSNGNNTSIVRKRIAMFSMNSDPLAPLGSQQSGGKEVYVRHLAEELSRLGWHVDIFTRLDSLKKNVISTFGKNIRVIRLKGGPAKYVGKEELLSLIPDIFNSFLEFIQFQNPYLLFHGHRFDGGIIALMAKEKFQKPLVQNFHTLGVGIIETKKRYTRGEEEKEYLSERIAWENKIIKQADKIIALAEPGREDLENLYHCPPGKIRVISGGVNLRQWPLTEKQKSREYLMIKPEEFVLLFVGRLEWAKGLSTLINTVNLLAEEIPHIRVLVVGGKIFGQVNKADYREYKRIMGIVEEKNLQDNVQFTGNVENKALSHYYRSADVLVVPSYYEGFGLVALEGMANKIPVVASNVGGLAWIIQHEKNGLLFETRNTLDLKNKILEIFKSKDLVKKLTENAYRELSEKYSWREVAIKISKEYDELLQGESVVQMVPITVKRKLKIAQIAPPQNDVPPKKYGGIELMVHNLTEELVRRGHKVYLFASPHSRTRGTLVPVYEQEIAQSSQAEDQARIEALKWAGIGNILKELEKIEVDIVHHNWSCRLNPFFWSIKAPVVSTIHYELVGDSIAAAYKIFKNDRYVAISNNQKRGIPDLNYVGTIYHGIDTNKFTFSDKKGDYFVFLGRIWPLKGPKEAIEIAKKAGVNLKIAARIDIGQAQEYFDKEIKPLIDGHHIQFIGEVDQEQKNELLKNALALLSPIQWEEPFGLVNVEAMACGTPVISFKRGALPEIVEDKKTGFLCDPGNMEQMIAAVDKIQNMPEDQYAKMRHACRQVVDKKFSIQKMADEYEKIYYRLLKRQYSPVEKLSFELKTPQ